MAAIKQSVVVKDGGVVELQSDRLPAGASVDVTVVMNEAPAKFPTMKSIIGATSGTFRSSEEIDAYLRAERDAWDK